MTMGERLSPTLLAHVEEMPLVRRPILQAVSAFAAQLPPGSRVLDAGSGNAPYAELFGHCEYVTADWPQSVHEGARQANIVASLEALPVPDEAFQAVLCTEVLEHPVCLATA
jgi:ubiquinone/menaquinone biosynthesis C-methylase UbiE